jgi:hypothetical protein
MVGHWPSSTENNISGNLFLKGFDSTLVTCILNPDIIKLRAQLCL